MERNLLEREDDDLLIEEGEENGLEFRREAIEGGPEKGGSWGRHAARIGDGRAANLARPERTNDVRGVIVPARDIDNAGEKTAIKELGRAERVRGGNWLGRSSQDSESQTRAGDGNLVVYVIGGEEISVQFVARFCGVGKLPHGGSI